MKYNFNQIIDRKGTFSVKNDLLPQNSPLNAIPAWVADMDFTVAKPIQDALIQQAHHGIFGYTYYHSEDLKEATRNWFLRRFQWEVPKEAFVYSPGVVPAVGTLVEILSEPGDAIIIQKPVYHPFQMQIEKRNRIVANNPLRYEKGEYSIDFEDLEQQFAREDTAGLIFCSPHNPVGRVWTKAEIQRVGDLAKKYDKWIISDEIHMDLTRMDVIHEPFAKICSSMTDRVYICTAPSKSFNIAGLHMSNIIIYNEEIREKFENIGLGSPSPFAVAATLAAYKEGDEWLDQLRLYFDEVFAWISSFLEKNLPQAILSKAEATYLAWVDVSAYAKDGWEEQIIKEGLIVNQGEMFGEEGKYFVRVNVASPKSTVEEMFIRLAKALQ